MIRVSVFILAFCFYILSCTQEPIAFEGYNQFEVKRLFQGDSSKTWQVSQWGSLSCWDQNTITFYNGDTVTFTSDGYCEDGLVTNRATFATTSLFNDPVDSVLFLFNYDSLIVESDTMLAFRDTIFLELVKLLPDQAEFTILNPGQGAVTLTHTP